MYFLSMYWVQAVVFSVILSLSAALACSPPPCSPEKTTYEKLPFDRVIRTQQIVCMDKDTSYTRIDTLYRSDMVEVFYKTIHSHENAFFAEILDIVETKDPEWDSTTYKVLKTLSGGVEEKSKSNRLTKSGTGGDCTFKMVKKGGVLLTAYDDVEKWNFNNSSSNNYFYLKSAKDSLIRNDHWPDMTIDVRSVNWAKYGKE